jgi:hypothetical protein
MDAASLFVSADDLAEASNSAAEVVGFMVSTLPPPAGAELVPTPAPVPVPVLPVVGAAVLGTTNSPLDDEPLKLTSPEYVAFTE